MSEDKVIDVVLIVFFCFIFTVAGFVFYGMYQQGKLVVLNTEYRQYEVIGINPPKHFRLDLKDVKTNRIYENVSVSKHCNNWRNLPLHSLFLFKEVTYKYSKKPEVYKDVEIDGPRFCSNLAK